MRVSGDQGHPVQIRTLRCDDRLTNGPVARFTPSNLGQPCVVQARRRDGALWTPWTDPQVARSTAADITLPDWTVGGLGVEVKGDAAGLRVLKVRPGSAGWQAGLEPGDVVTSVNGTSLAGLGEGEAVDLVVGPVGSTVRLGLIDVRTGGAVQRSARRQTVD